MDCSQCTSAIKIVEHLGNKEIVEHLGNKQIVEHLENINFTIYILVRYCRIRHSSFMSKSIIKLQSSALLFLLFFP